MNNNDILTIKEVADYLKIAEKTAYRFALEKKIPGFKIGNAWRFRKEEIEKWMKNSNQEEGSITNYAIGKSYEDFVEMVYKAILEAERKNGQIGSINLERRKKIISKSGTEAEIDIYWEYMIAGIKHCVAIECRNYNKNVDIPGVRDFARKISDISGLKGLMVTKKGFSENAIKEAKADNIDLIVLREQQIEDWDGRIREIKMNMIFSSPSITKRIEPKINKEWAIENGYKSGVPINIQCRNDLMIFEDTSDNFRHSLYDLESKDFFGNNESGSHIWKKDFKDGWMHTEDKSLKIDSIEIEYEKPPLFKNEMVINFESYVLAVMEYISGESGKYVIMASGDRRIY